MSIEWQVHEHLCVLFGIDKNWKQAKCLLTGEQVNSSGILLSIKWKKKNKLLIHATTAMNLILCYWKQWLLKNRLGGVDRRDYNGDNYDETFGSTWFVHCLDCVNGFSSIHIYRN